MEDYKCADKICREYVQKYIDTLPFHLQPARLYDVKWDDFEDSKFFSQYNDELLEKLGSAKFKGFTFA
jgi:hypothetical protein